MSFSMIIKDEVSKVEENRTEKLAELSAILRNSSIINKNLQITVENNSVARRIFTLFKDIYDIIPVITVRRRSGLNNNLIYILTINNNYKEILRDLSIIDSNNCFLQVPHDYIIADDDDIRAYLRGVFMTSGSVNDPKTSRYHLEIVVDSIEYATFINNILNNFNLNSKIIRREKNYMIYIKEAEKISDFLRIIKAYSGVMYFEDIRIYRDHKNMTNRLNNCEQANMDKIFLTANKQLKDIKIIEDNGLMEMLDSKLREAVSYRTKYPENSLAELADIMSKELGYSISKSGLNHRFRKLRNLAEQINNN